MEGIKIIKNTTIYKCKYCGKVYILKRFAEKHHLKCRKNPKNISACYERCNRIELKEIEVLCSNSHNEWYQKVKTFYCSKKDIYLKPRWAGDIDTYFFGEEMPDIEKMPLECEDANCSYYFNQPPK